MRKSTAIADAIYGVACRSLYRAGALVGYWGSRLRYAVKDRFTQLTAIVCGIALVTLVGLLVAPGAKANGAPTVENMTITGGIRSLTVTWSPPITEYPDAWQFLIGSNRATEPFAEPDQGAVVYGYSHTITGLEPGTNYRVWIVATGADNHSGIPVTRFGTTTPAVQPAVAAPVAVKPGAPAPIGRAAASRCAFPGLATRTTITKATRATRSRLRLSGSTSYWTPAGWQGAPSSDYRLTVQRLNRGRWGYVTRIVPGRATTIGATRGTYRLAFPGICSQPVAPSASRAVTR